MDQIPRRAMLYASMASVAAIGVDIETTARSRPSRTALAPPPRYAGPIVSVNDRATLAAIEDLSPGRLVHLDEPGREGLFRCVVTADAPVNGATDAPADPPADPLQGLYVAARRPGFGWARVWDGTHGRPEWFGARGENPGADCADALEACHAHCPVTQLAQADYFVGRTIHLARSWRTVRGAGRYATDQRQGTRIILQRTATGVRTDDIVVLGTTTRPGGELVTEAHLSDLTLVRDGPAQPHASGDLARYPTGLRCAYLSHCTVSGVAALESSVGFYIGGVVYTKVDDCLAQRTRPGEGTGADLAAGYLLDGRVRFGFPGGNASLYMDRCVAAEQHAHHVDPAGLIALGAFVDSFIDRFESARIDTGMAFHAAGARGFGETIDLHVRNPVLDGCGRFGLDLDLDATASACVEIIDPYVTPAGQRGERGISVRDGAGLVTITGGQVLGDFAGGSLVISRTRGVRVQGLKIAQSVRPVVVSWASGLQLEPQISNWRKTAPGAAIEARAVSRASLRPIVIGFDAPAFAAGIDLDPACQYVHVDGSAIDPECLVGGAAAKVRFGGIDARDSQAARQFAAAGNVLGGVTG